MNSLIEEALKHNTDLRIATARIDEYVGRYWVGRSGLFPQIGANAQAGRSRVSQEGATPLSSQTENPADFYQGVFNGSWEIDIWGKLRRATEASRADLLATRRPGRRSFFHWSALWPTATSFYAIWTSKGK